MAEDTEAEGQTETESDVEAVEDETDVDFVPNIASLQYSVSPFEKKTFKMEEMFDLEDDRGNSEKKKR